MIDWKLEAFLRSVKQSKVKILQFARNGDIQNRHSLFNLLNDDSTQGTGYLLARIRIIRDNWIIPIPDTAKL
jgi:hypothetical protein